MASIESFDPFSLDDEIEQTSYDDVRRSGSSDGGGGRSSTLSRTASKKNAAKGEKRQLFKRRTTAAEDADRGTTTSNSEQRVGSPKPLPPRLNVALTLHEEVSSVAIVDPSGGETTGGSLSQLSIDGTVTVRPRCVPECAMQFSESRSQCIPAKLHCSYSIYHVFCIHPILRHFAIQYNCVAQIQAQIESSNANENCPLSLEITGPMTSLASIICQNHCRQEVINDAVLGSARYRLDIPKNEARRINVLKYSMNVRTQVSAIDMTKYILIRYLDCTKKYVCLQSFIHASLYGSYGLN